jgi:RNA polymerase sigma factor (sigma-70 family)
LGKLDSQNNTFRIKPKIIRRKAVDSRELKEVVLRAQKGDSTAIEKLYTEFYESVFYFAKKTLRDDELACDITQETFMELIRTIDKLEAPEAFASWIRQITYHQCTRYFKKKKDVLVDEDEDGNSVFDNLEDEDTPVPEEVCENEEFRSTILSIVDTLSEEQRSAVLLYYYDELPISKIAEMQGVSEGTVKSRLNYARKAIRSGVEQYEKKTGTKLHAIPFLPLIRIFFGAPEAMAASQSAAIGGAVSAAASAAATTAAIAGASGSAATAAAVRITAKLAAIPFGAKIAAAVLALSVTVTAGAVIVSNTETPSDIDNSDITVFNCAFLQFTLGEAGLNLLGSLGYVGEKQFG